MWSEHYNNYKFMTMQSMLGSMWAQLIFFHFQTIFTLNCPNIAFEFFWSKNLKWVIIKTCFQEFLQNGQNWSSWLWNHLGKIVKRPSGDMKTYRNVDVQSRNGLQQMAWKNRSWGERYSIPKFPSQTFLQM